jgi:arylsulfatase A-like enzyme
VTFGTGKWHNGTALFNRSFSSGGAIFFGGMDDHSQTTIHDYDPAGRYPASAGRPSAKFSSRTFAETALTFLRTHDRNTPYLLYVAFTSPHDPRMAPKHFEAMYSPKKVRLPKNFRPQHPFDNGELKVRDELLAGFPRTEEEVRKHIAGYYAMISEVDHQIGRILDAVGRSAWVVFASDNGLAVGQHGLMGKQNLYDHSWRVPMIISGPNVPRNRRADTLCYLMDLCPTILEIAGVPVPSGLEARSLRPSLENPDASVRDCVIGAYRQVQRAIRTDQWKLILYNVAGQRTTQLFDLRTDPLETKNLADRPELSPRIAELTALLQRELKEAGDGTDLNAPAWVGSDEP